MSHYPVLSIIFSCLVALFVTTPTWADECWPGEFSTVPNVITITPDGSFAYTVNIAGCLGPINGALVLLEFTSGAAPEAEGLVAWAVGQAHPLLSASSNVNGDAIFMVAGGGCIDPVRYNGASNDVVRVFADGILLAIVGINSPDVVTSSGLLPTDTNISRPDGANTCDGGTMEVGLSDAVFHTVPFALGTTEFCSNFTGPDFNDPVGLADAVVATPYIKSGTSAACQ